MSSTGLPAVDDVRPVNSVLFIQRHDYGHYAFGANHATAVASTGNVLDQCNTAGSESTHLAIARLSFNLSCTVAKYLPLWLRVPVAVPSGRGS